MATEQRSGGGNGFLYFAIGALIVAVAVLAWMFYGGVDNPDRVAENTAIERSADAVGDAAEDLSDSVRDATRNAPAPATTPPPAETPG
jgi:hypothetical protein